MFVRAARSLLFDIKRKLYNCVFHSNSIIENSFKKSHSNTCLLVVPKSICHATPLVCFLVDRVKSDNKLLEDE